MNENICQLYLKGLSVSAICKSLNTSTHYVRKTLKIKKIKMRTSRELNRKYRLNENFLDVLDSWDKFYFLGWFASDGCLARPDRIAFSVQKRDIEILEKLRSLIGSNQPVSILKREGPGEVMGVKCQMQDLARINFNSKYLGEAITRLGFRADKSSSLTFPAWIPDIYLGDFCRGLYEGDGNMSKSTRDSCYQANITGTKNLCEGLSERLKTFDIPSYICNPKRNIFVIRISGNYACLKFFKLIYGSARCYLTRRYQKYLDMIADLKTRTGLQNKTKIALAHH